jgi:hypothetical protein
VHLNVPERCLRWVATTLFCCHVLESNTCLQTAHLIIFAVANDPDNLCLPKYWLWVLPYSEIVMDADVFCVLQVTLPRFVWREAAHGLRGQQFCYIYVIMSASDRAAD